MPSPTSKHRELIIGLIPTTQPAARASNQTSDEEAAAVSGVGRSAAAIKSAPGGREAAPSRVLLHELTEALTAIGNYLTAATRMRSAEAEPAGAKLQDVLEKSESQFSRAVEVLQRLRNSIS
jgi:hypothetical protein